MCDSCGRPSVTEDLRDHSHGEAEHGAEVDTRTARAAGHHHPAGRVAGSRWAQVRQRRPRVGLTMGLPGDPYLRGGGDRRKAPSPHGRPPRAPPDGELPPARWM